MGNQGKKIFWSFGILEKAEKERKTRDSEIDNYFILFLLFRSIWNREMEWYWEEMYVNTRIKEICLGYQSDRVRFRGC